MLAWVGKALGWAPPRAHDMLCGCAMVVTHASDNATTHMRLMLPPQVPHDRPEVSQRMIEAFVESAQRGLSGIEMAAARRLQQGVAAS